MTQRPPSHRLRARLLDALSQALEPGQRDAVLGDLTETGAGDWASVKAVVSLITREQVQLWLDWRPWVAVVMLVLPLSLLVSRLSQHWAQGTALYVATVANHASLAVAGRHACRQRRRCSASSLRC